LNNIRRYLIKGIKLVIPVALIVIALTVIGIGMVSAQDNTSTYTKTNKFVIKVANILGLEVIQVDEAFEQAREEIRNEMIEDIEVKSSITLENGDITRAEVEKKIDYLKNKKWIFPREKFHNHKKDLAHANKKHKFFDWLNDKEDWSDKAKVKNSD